MRQIEHSDLDRFDPMLPGLAHVGVVEPRLHGTCEAARAEFNAAVARIPEIEQVHLVAGHVDHLMKVRTQNMADYRHVLAERISTLPHLAKTSTCMAMQAVKEDALADVIRGAPRPGHRPRSGGCKGAISRHGRGFHSGADCDRVRQKRGDLSMPSFPGLPDPARPADPHTGVPENIRPRRDCTDGDSRFGDMVERPVAG